MSNKNPWVDNQATGHPLFNESADSHMKRGFEFIMHGLLLTLPLGRTIAFTKTEDGHAELVVGDSDLSAGVKTLKPVFDYAPGETRILDALMQCVTAVADTLAQESDQTEMFDE